jgi:uncharacterized C2H2 Zn-finger protein
MTKLTIKIIHSMHSIDSIDSNYSIIHQYSQKTKEWKFSGYRCLYCENVFKTDLGIHKHQSICKELNTIKKKREVFMPIQVITVRGERMYRWGDQGKLYKDRSDAEKQAQAAHAAGYKEKQMKDKNK